MARSGFDSRVVAEAQAGDEQARERLLGQLAPVLRSFFLSRIGPRTEVDDLIQNTLLRVHNGLAELRDPQRLKGFTMKAALFELQDYYRGRYRAKEHLYDPEAPPRHPPVDGEAGAGFDVERALAALSPRAREIIELRECGYHYEEIARMVGTTEAAVKMQVKRAFEKMRAVLVGVLILFVLHVWLRV